MVQEEEKPLPLLVWEEGRASAFVSEKARCLERDTSEGKDVQAFSTTVMDVFVMSRHIPVSKKVLSLSLGVPEEPRRTCPAWTSVEANT